MTTRGTVDQYLAKLGAGAPPAELAALFAEDVDFDASSRTASSSRAR